MAFGWSCKIGIGKCSWSEATTNIRFTLEKWYDKPKNKKNIDRQPELY